MNRGSASPHHKDTTRTYTDWTSLLIVSNQKSPNFLYWVRMLMPMNML